MNYRITLSKKVRKQVSKYPTVDVHKIHDAMLTLSQEPRPRGVRKLSDREYYRIRVGEYRILYTINDDDKVVTIYRVGPRKDVYKS